MPALFTCHQKTSFLCQSDNLPHRKSRPDVFCKKGILENFAKFTGKHLCQSLFFNKVAMLRPANVLKMRLWHSCFPVNFAKFLRTPVLQNTSARLFLPIEKNRIYYIAWKESKYGVFSGPYFPVFGVNTDNTVRMWKNTDQK